MGAKKNIPKKGGSRERGLCRPLSFRFTYPADFGGWVNRSGCIFTMMILDDGGWEINPVVRSVIELYGDGFWIWKFVLVSISLTLLCIHSKFRFVLPVILGIITISVLVILYQIFTYVY